MVASRETPTSAREANPGGREVVTTSFESTAWARAVAVARRRLPSAWIEVWSVLPKPSIGMSGAKAWMRCRGIPRSLACSAAQVSAAQPWADPSMPATIRAVGVGEVMPLMMPPVEGGSGGGNLAGPGPWGPVVTNRCGFVPPS